MGKQQWKHSKVMINMNGLYLFGAGGHAKVIAEIAELIQLDIKGAFDHNLIKEYLLDQYPIYYRMGDVEIKSSDKFIIAIGNNGLRKRISEDELKDKTFETLIHPRSTLSKRTEIGEGTVIMAGVTINVDSQIGQHCIINTNASIDHDCTIEDFVHISPNVSLAGNILVGEGTHVGIGACVIQGVKIGKWCTIGAGAVIIRDVPDGATVVGNPGKTIKKLS